MALALQQAVMTFMGSWGKNVAYSDRDGKSSSKAQVLCTGVVYSTLVYILNALEYQSNFCYIILSGLYTVGLALIFPVMDSMTTEYLECHSRNTTENFACERLYGAISWIFTNLYMACALDWFGFDCTYPMAVYSTFTAIATVYFYTSLNSSMADIKQMNGGDHESFAGDGLQKKGKDPDDIDRGSNTDSDSHTSRTSTDMTRTTRSDSDFESVEGIIEGLPASPESPTQFNRSPNLQRKPYLSSDSSDVSSLGISLRSSDDSSSSHSDDEDNLQPTSSKNGTPLEIVTGQDSNDRLLSEPNQRKEKNIHMGRIYSKIWFSMFSTCYGCSFLLFYTCLCAGQSVVDNLAFLYFRQLGAPYLLMGYSVVITISMELPLVSSLFKCCGGNMMLVMAGFAFVVRVIGYSLVPPHIEGYGVWYMLLLEPLHGLIYAGTLTAVTDYVKVVIPRKDYWEVAKSMVYAMRGLGMTVGILLGGFQCDAHGAKFMFRDLALIVLVATVSFVLAIGLDRLFLGPNTTVTSLRKKERKSKKTKLNKTEDEDDFDRPTIDEYLQYL